MSSTPTPLPTKIGILIFPGFQLLDYAGPLDALNILSYTYPLSLYTIASSLSPVSTQTSSGTERGSAFAQCVIPTHTFETAPRDLDVVIVPGGLGMRGEGMEERMRGVGEWLEGMVGEDGEGIGKEGVRWILTICTGSEILARTGVLDGRRATTNKRAFNEVKARHPNVNWIAKARWVVDGRFWTSSGVSAGMDLTFAWIGAVFGEGVAQAVAERSEYVRNVDSENDGGFAARWGAV